MPRAEAAAAAAMRPANWTVFSTDKARQAAAAVGVVETGTSVVFGFRVQAFVTRAYTAGVS